MLRITFVIALASMLSLDTFAQTRRGGGTSNPGPRYNPPSRSGGSSGSPSRGSASPSRGSGGGTSNPGPRYNPPSRSSGGSTTRPTPSTRPSNTPTAPRTGGTATPGPRYNPPGNGNTTRPSTTPRTGGTTTPGPRYNPPGNGNTTRPSTTPAGPRYNPPGNGNGNGNVNTTPRGPRYNPPAPGNGGRSRVVNRLPSYRSQSYGTPNFHRPYRYVSAPYTRYYHSPYSGIYRHTMFWTPFSYFGYMQSHYRNYLYMNWIFWQTPRANGYYVIDGYPYYVYNNYRHRYSNFDKCNYQLVDSYTERVVTSYWQNGCAQGYNICANDRDQRNDWENSNRFYCAETFRDQNYQFNSYNENNGYVGGYYDQDEDYNYSNEYDYPEYYEN